MESLSTDTLVAARTASTPIFGSKFHSPRKGARPTGKLSGSEAGAGKVQDEPETTRARK